MRVGVVGAGTMGSGIAEAFARSEGFEVLLSDTTMELARRGHGLLSGRLAHQVNKGRIPGEDMTRVLERVGPALVTQLGECDLVVEAILEEPVAKRSLFEQLDELCRPDAILASNTSSLSITEIGAGLRHPVVGMHFFNPAPVMALIEVVAGADTPSSVIDAVKGVSESIGKTPVEVEEGPGFVVNRILIPMINEGIGLVADGTASVEDIDTAMKLGANHRMGPLALGDLIGLDVVLAIMEVIQQEMGDPKYRPHPLLRKYVRAGRLGRKTGRGFYQYG